MQKYGKKSVITAASVLMLGSVLLPSHLTALAAPSGAQQSTAVTKDQAKEIAASKAGLSVSDLSFFWMEKEWDDGRLCYEGAIRPQNRQNMNLRSM